MKIGFYVHHSTISAGGIFTYSIGILKQLLKSSEIEKVIIITSEEVNNQLKELSIHPKVQITNINRNNLIVRMRLYLYFTILMISSLVHKLIPVKVIHNSILTAANLLNPYLKVLNENETSIFHVPVQYSPIYKTKIPVLITMHDLQEYHYPDFFSTKEKLFRKIKNHLAIMDSDAIVVSFSHVKKDILQQFKVNNEKIFICPPPFSENWFVNSKETNWLPLENKYNLKKNYILYPAATWEHKNHLTLINAIKILRDEGNDIHLVCTGNKTESYKKIKTEIEKLEISDFVHFLGIVPEEDLIGLYKNAKLVVIPTLYEAGSGPLYEAMRYLVPVVCSNVTSLPETIESEDFTFNPVDIYDMMEKIKLGLFDEGFRKRNIENSKVRMEELSRLNYPENFINAYKYFST